MATYIKIRELTPYAGMTGVFTGDMLALALDTTTPGTPHTVEGTQRATVDQVINSYNIQAAEALAADAGITPAELANPNTTLPSSTSNVITTYDSSSSQCVISEDPSLTARTFSSVIKIGGGLEYSPTVQSTDANGCQTYSYALSTASSATAVDFNVVVSGGSLDATYSLIPGTDATWVSGRFPTLKSATSWASANIPTASTLNFLIANDVTEDRIQNESDISSSSIQDVHFLSYAAYALTLDQSLNIGFSDTRYQETNSYSINNIVQYTGLNNGTIGDWNLYRSLADTNAGNTPSSSPGSWARMKPDMTTGAALYDPNGFSSAGFTSRPTLTFNSAPTSLDGRSIFWFKHGGDTSFTNLKVKVNNINTATDTSYRLLNKIIRKDEGYWLNIASTEIHLNGSILNMVFELVNSSRFRVWGSADYGLPSVPDPYGVTGSAGSYTPIPGLYLCASGLTGDFPWTTPNYQSGIGCIVDASQTSQVYLGNEYWASQGSLQLNQTHELSRVQLGSGKQHLTACVEASSATEVGGNTPMSMCPDTQILASNINLDKDYITPGGPYPDGLGVNSPDVAPIAAYQFISNNTQKFSTSGNRPPSAGSTNPYVSWAGTKGSSGSIASGDSFISSLYDGFPSGTTGLATYPRYPD